MTSAVDRIEELRRAWRLQHDALKIVRREVLRNLEGIETSGMRLSNTQFEEAKIETIEDDIRACQRAAADYTVLSMWAVFERHLFNRIEIECQKMREHPIEAFNQGVTDKVIKDVEYWKIDDALEILKQITGSDVVGFAKQIKHYRDWVVHRNPRKPTPAKIDPDTTKDILIILAKELDIDRKNQSCDQLK